MTNDNIDYLFLTKATARDGAEKQVSHFLTNTDLIAYESFKILHKGCMTATSNQFWVSIEEGIRKNMEFARMVLEELQATGVAKLEDLLDLSPGYPSKTLHILTHMIDGFISVDSSFYNLVEDSHKVSHKMKDSIAENPERYWLIPVVTGTLKSSLLHPSPKQPEQ